MNTVDDSVEVAVDSMPVAAGSETATRQETTESEPAVELDELCKKYGKFTAVRDLTMSVPAGSIYGLVGPNGAGKTTTFAIVATLLKPTSGAAKVFGIDPSGNSKQVRDVRGRLGYMPDGLGVYANLDVEEYLRFFAAAYKLSPRLWDDLVDGLLELVALGGKRQARVDSLSRGMKQRLSLARALIHDPDLLILDEPASGLDPRARAELRDLLLQLSTMGKTIIISSHILAELEDVCTHIGIIQDGSMLATGRTREITRQVAVQRRVEAHFTDGTSEEFECTGDDEQADLLRRLVDENDRTLVEFRRVGGGLEELFLSITKQIDE